MLDVRNAPSPAHVQSGMLLGQTPMATRLSVPGAARAIPSTTRHRTSIGCPASSTGAVFVPGAGAPGRVAGDRMGARHCGSRRQLHPRRSPRSALDSSTSRIGSTRDTRWSGPTTSVSTPGLMSYPTPPRHADRRLGEGGPPDGPAARRQVGHRRTVARRRSSDGRRTRRGAPVRRNRAGLPRRRCHGCAGEHRAHIVALLGPVRDGPAARRPRDVLSYIMAGFRGAARSAHRARAEPTLGGRSSRRPECAAIRKWRNGCRVPPAAGSPAPLNSIPKVLGALTAYMGTPVTGYTRPIFLRQGTQDIDVPAALSPGAVHATEGQ